MTRSIGVDEIGTTTSAPVPPSTQSRWVLLRSTAILGAALLAGNAGNYLLAVAASHKLSSSSYGLFGSLLAVLLIGGIPALAIQAVVARRTAVSHLSLSHAVRSGLLTGLVCAGVGIAVTPGLAVFLHVPHHGFACFWIMAGLLPLGVLGAVQGHLQGEEAFSRLSTLVLIVGAGRLFGGVVPLVAGGSVTWVMAGVTLGAAAAAIVSLRLARYAGEGPVTPATAVAPELLAATVSMGALLLLSNLDVLLARHLLPSGSSGHYAAGTVVAKVAFWLPQAVPLTALPRLSRAPGRAKALREAVTITGVVAVISVAVTSALGPFLTRLTFGAGYSGIGHDAWLFALQGSALAGVQLLVIDDIANQRRRTAPLILVAAAVEMTILLVANPGTARQIISVACAVAVSLAVVAGTLEYRRLKH